MTLPVVPPPESGLAEAAVFVNAAAGILEMPVDPAYLDGVVRNFAVLMGHASLVMAFALESTIEVAPVFRA